MNNAFKFSMFVSTLTAHVVTFYLAKMTEGRYNRLKAILDHYLKVNDELPNNERYNFSNWEKLTLAKNILFDIRLTTAESTSTHVSDDPIRNRQTVLTLGTLCMHLKG